MLWFDFFCHLVHLASLIMKAETFRFHCFNGWVVSWGPGHAFVTTRELIFDSFLKWSHFLSKSSQSACICKCWWTVKLRQECAFWHYPGSCGMTWICHHRFRQTLSTSYPPPRETGGQSEQLQPDSLYPSRAPYADELPSSLRPVGRAAGESPQSLRLLILIYVFLLFGYIYTKVHTVGTIILRLGFMSFTFY